ncbi:MAG: MotA/TolQ/ExbB proton channel family protein [Sumerlaeia bacterium]
MMKTYFLFVTALILSLSLMVQGQQVPQATAEFGSAATSAEQRLENSLQTLSQLREKMAEQTIPLSKELSALENELREVRTEFQQTSRLLDTRTLDLSNLRSEIKTREDETAYLSNLLGEYIRNFESRLHIVELQRYEKELEEAKLAPENTALSEEEIFNAQATLLTVSVDRLVDNLGGTRFQGTGVDRDGSVKNGTILLLGPSALFMSEDGTRVGTAEQRLGSLEPAVIEFREPADIEVASAVITSGTGFFPLDPTQGNAHKVEETKESLLDHIKKGGPVMYPIFAMAGVALIVAFYKWLAFLLVRDPSKKSIQDLVNAVSRGEVAEVQRLAKRMNSKAPNFLTDWMHGAAAGALIGSLIYILLNIDLGVEFSPPILEFAATNTLLTFAVIFAVVFGALEFLLRLLFGYSPVGIMLAAGVEHLEYPAELVEEVMYEKVLAIRLRLESLLSLVSICAASAPLLGLLGTVTGIINTFKLITVFGSGDVKTLSGGISEALVTTEYGLIVAIPSLLIHAFLSRRVKGVINKMEAAGVALINQLSKTPISQGDSDDEPEVASGSVEAAKSSGKSSASSVGTSTQVSPA